MGQPAMIQRGCGCLARDAAGALDGISAAPAAAQVTRANDAEDGLQREIDKLLKEVVRDVPELARSSFWVRAGRPFATACLRSRDFDKTLALRLIRRFDGFRRRAGWPYAMQLHASPEVLRALCSGVHWVLPRPDLEGRTLVVFRPRLLEKIHVEIAQRMGCFVLEWATGFIPTPVHERASRHLPHAGQSVAFIVDLAGVGADVLFRFGMSDLRRGFTMWQDRFPVKLRVVYLLDAGAASRIVLGLCQTFMPEKLRQRVFSFNSGAASGPGSFADLRARLGGRLDGVPAEWGGRLDYSASDGAEAPGDCGWAAVVRRELAAARDAAAAAQSPGGRPAGDEPGATHRPYMWYEAWVNAKCAQDTGQRGWPEDSM